MIKSPGVNASIAVKGLSTVPRVAELQPRGLGLCWKRAAFSEHSALPAVLIDINLDTQLR